MFWAGVGFGAGVVFVIIMLIVIGSVRKVNW